MYATIPVYYPSLEEAARKDEAALWCDSYNINMSCRNFIQDKAMTAFNTRELDAFIEELVRCYGTERAMYVLSRTIQFSDWDARFDQAVLDRAGKTDFPDTREPREAHQVDPTTRYVTEIDPCVVTSPFSILSQWLIGDEVNVVEDFQKQYGYNQQLGIYEKDYIDGSGQSYEGIIFTDGVTEVVYYNQLDERWADLPYGTDNIGGYGCGPTSMAIVVSSLTDQTVDPPTMAEWAYQNGYWCSGNGSYHSLIPGAAEGFGLQWESISTDDPQAVVDTLASGKLIVALMSKGHFTSSGHFMVLRGVTSEGKILVADPASKKRSEQEWDISIILDEARKGAAAGGPLWAIY